MRLKLVRLFAVVIALVLPVQGMTAVAAGQCMALEHHQSPGARESHGQALEAHDHAAHSHSLPGEAGSKADGDESNGKSAHCGPCTACCASASIAGPAGVSILSSASDALYVFSQFPPLGVQSPGFDRPPLAL